MTRSTRWVKLPGLASRAALFCGGRLSSVKGARSASVATRPPSAALDPGASAAPNGQEERAGASPARSDARPATSHRSEVVRAPSAPSASVALEPGEEPYPRHEQRATHSNRGQVAAMNRLEGEGAADSEVLRRFVDCQNVGQFAALHEAVRPPVFRSNPSESVRVIERVGDVSSTRKVPLTCGNSHRPKPA